MGHGGDGISRFFRIQQGVWADRDTGRVKKKRLHMNKGKEYGAKNCG
jgi:hypothetical protein